MKPFILFAIYSLAVAVPLKPFYSTVPIVLKNSKELHSNKATTMSFFQTATTPDNAVILKRISESVYSEPLRRSLEILENNRKRELLAMNQRSTVTRNTQITTESPKTTTEVWVSSGVNLTTIETTPTTSQTTIIQPNTTSTTESPMTTVETEFSSGENLTTITTEAKPSVKETSTIQTTSTTETTTTSFETEGSSDESSMTITLTEPTTTIVIEDSTTVIETTTSEPFRSTTIIETTKVTNSSFSETADETTNFIETTTSVLEEVVKHEVDQLFSVFGPYVLALTVLSSIFLIVSVVFRLRRSRKLIYI